MSFWIFPDPVKGENGGKKPNCIKEGEWCDASLASTPCCGEYCSYDDRELGFRCPKDTTADLFASAAAIAKDEP